MAPRERSNILLVDDQPGKLMSLETILDGLNENIIKASSADEALKRLLEHEIAVVLVDVCMPNMDGFELAELIRTHPRYQRTAIIFISAIHLSDDDRLRGYELGAVDYIPVPIIPEVLRAKVAVFAELNRKTNQLERLNTELAQRVAQLDASNERLRFADRMATVGTLAAGLGHDIGNLLLPIRMHLDSLADNDIPKSARDDVAAIRGASEYLQRLAASLQLLTTDSRTENALTASTDIAEWWRQTETIIRTGVPRTVVLTGRVPADLPAARIGKAALTQLVFNLVQNAGDALKTRTDGRITVEFCPGKSPNTIQLAVSDNGPGMDDDSKRRCLDPYFTTKTRELGTGLGLTLVAGLVQHVQGTIQVESAPGQGAKFLIEIPLAHSASSSKSSGKPSYSTAVVTLADPRAQAHVRSVLASLDFDVQDMNPAEADVWITECADQNALDKLRTSTSIRRGSRIFVFTPVAGTFSADDRFTFLSPEVKPSLLRSRIQGALQTTPAPSKDTP